MILVPRSALATQARILPPATAPDLAFQVIRVEDMLYLGFEFYNAHAEVVGGQVHIVPTDTKKPTYMVVVFPSQHLGSSRSSTRRA